MLDWKKETTDQNYCGYCSGGPTGWCNGNCFNLDFHIGSGTENRKKHALAELEKIPQQRQQLDQRETDLKQELNS